MTVPAMTHDQTTALAAFDKGIPSCLPDGNRYKAAVENHRWGRHGQRPIAGCPACMRHVCASATAAGGEQR